MRKRLFRHNTFSNEYNIGNTLVFIVDLIIFDKKSVYVRKNNDLTTAITCNDSNYE